MCEWKREEESMCISGLGRRRNILLFPFLCMRTLKITIFVLYCWIICLYCCVTIRMYILPCLTSMWPNDPRVPFWWIKLHLSILCKTWRTTLHINLNLPKVVLICEYLYLIWEEKLVCVCMGSQCGEGVCVCGGGFHSCISVISFGFCFLELSHGPVY